MSFERFLRAASRPVDVMSLAVFRIALGSILLWEVWRYFHYGWIRDFYVASLFHFTYPGFHWVQPWPGNGMYWHFLAIGGAAVLVVLGVGYRLAMTSLAVGMTYVLLLEQTAFLNHLYLVCLILALMVFVPADRALSWTARRLDNPNPTVPAWCLWLIRAQLAIPYFYGGLVKLNPDWLQGQPLQLWMAQMTHVRDWLPMFGEKWLALVFSYAGIVIDLAAVPLLLWSRTRAIAFTVAMVFHLCNAVMFQIGIFPWFMIAATTLFFEPNWPRNTLLRCGWKSEPGASSATQNIGRPRFVMALMSAWFAIQLLVPWRHALYPGPVDWTEEGSRFAWRMMLHDKWSALRFVLVNPATNAKRPFNPLPFLSPRQLNKMSYEPELLRVFSHFIAEQLAAAGLPRHEVRVQVWCSLNGRRPQLLIDPNVDLSVEPARWHQPWIMPLTEPMPETPWIPPVEMRGHADEL